MRSHRPDCSHRLPRPALTTVAALATLAGTALAGDVFPTWQSPQDGLWNNALFWSPAIVPLPFQTAILPHAQAYTVTMGASNTIGGLTISNPLARLDIGVFSTLTMQGPIVNDGVITVNPTDAAAVAAIHYPIQAGIGGSGRINLAGIFNRSQITTAPGAFIIHEAPHVIEGSGLIPAAMTNNSTIRAASPAYPLTLSTEPKTNTNLLQAQSGATLNINAVINQTGAGLVRATGAGSVVALQSAVINNGDIDGTHGGVIATAAGTSTLNSVTNLGNLEVRVFYPLLATNTLDNLGTITVNPTNAAAPTGIRFADNTILQGPGRIILTGWDARAEISTTTGEAFIHQAPHTIEGSGRISAAMTNNSTILANDTAHPLSLTGQAKMNNALLGAEDGATLILNTLTINQASDGLILATGPGSVVALQNTVINNGEVNGTDGGVIATALGTTTLNSVTNLGDIEVRVFYPLVAANTLDNLGTITVNPTNAAAATGIRFANNATLRGPGRIVLTGWDARAEISTNTGETFTHQAPHAIEGSGRISAAMTNNATILANNTAHPLSLTGQPKINNALLVAEQGATLVLNTLTINQTTTGRIHASGAGSLVALQSAVVNNGNINGTAGGVIATTSGTSTLNSVTNLGNLEVRVFYPLQIAAAVRNDARITVNPSNAGAATALIWTDDTALTGNGTVTLAGLSNRADIAIAAPATAATFGPDQRLEGIGRIAAPLTMHGILAPGLSVGTLQAVAPVTLTPTGVFEAEIAPASADLLASTSTFHADGTVAVALVDGFNPPLYWERTVVTATQGVTGAFDAVTGPAPADPRLELRARTLSTSVVVGAYCKADLAEPFNTVNVFDLFAYLDLYNAQDPAADLAAPFNSINVFDLFAYLDRYNQGCP